MSLLPLLFDLSLGLALGSCAVMLLLSYRETGRPFYAFMSMMSALAFGTAWLAQPRGAAEGFAAWVGSGAAAGAGLSGIAFVCFKADYGRVGLAALGLAMGSGMFCLRGACSGLEAAGPAVLFVGLLSALLSALLVGTVFSAMILGHYYLNIPMTERPIVRASLLYAGAVAARFLFGAALLFVAVGFGAVGGAEAVRELTVGNLPLFLMRIVFGILGPAVLAWMVYATARIKSTQSATGILYVAVVLVLIGELTARYLARETGLPV